MSAGVGEVKLSVVSCHLVFPSSSDARSLLAVSESSVCPYSSRSSVHLSVQQGTYSLRKLLGMDSFAPFSRRRLKRVMLAPVVGKLLHTCTHKVGVLPLCFLIVPSGLLE